MKGTYILLHFHQEKSNSHLFILYSYQLSLPLQNKEKCGSSLQSNQLSMKETSSQQWNQFYLKDVSFVNLMTRRIFNVLIVANPYDAFMLEDDGRVDEKIFNEYMELGLRYPPTFTQVSTTEEAERIIKSTNIDLVICMPGTADNDAFTIARGIKIEFPEIPIVVLTPFSHGITKRMENEDMSIFEYVFCWLGNTDLILSIIKLIEDRMNIEHDIRETGVQMILLVEDNIRFYSSVLPNLYKFLLAQSIAIIPLELYQIVVSL